MRCRSVFLLVLLNLAVIAHTAASEARGQIVQKRPEEVELFSLVLIAVDLERATTTMNLLDENDDGKLDVKERSKLSWRQEALKFDVDRSGDLTHLEVALQFAFRRALAGIEERDEVFANQMMSRYDRIKDQVLDANEISAGHWPDDLAKFDIDRDGQLTQFEVAAGLARERKERDKAGVTGLDNGQAIWFIDMYDVDKDRRLDPGEYEAAAEKMFVLDWKAVDENKDGLATTTELAFAMAARRKKFGIALLDQRGAFQNMNRLDRNRDRVLDADEILRGKWPDDPERYDLDKNKLLTRFELEAGLAAERHKLGVSDEDQAQATELIRRYDKNRNHAIDLHELELEPAADEPEQISIQVLVDYDFDLDQKLSPSEVATLFAMRRKKE